MRADDSRSQVRLMLSAVLLVNLGQLSLSPIIAPLARDVGMAEWQIGAVISLAAVMVVLTSQLWGRRSQSWGRKPVLVASLTLGTVSMFLFAITAELGMRGVITGTTLFVLFLALRGLAFGTAIAAVQPTAQAYIADVTPDEASRVKGMAGIGAVQGIAMIAGAALGGGLSAFGLLAPLIAIPLLILASLITVITTMRRQAATDLVKTPARVSPTDSRVWPFLIAGFGLFAALGFINVVMGFLVQDRLDLVPEEAGPLTGAVLVAAGVGMVLAQAVIVPRSGWRPVRLLRVGGSVSFAGFLLLLPDAGIALIIVATLVIALGLGIAIPGYTAGPTLAMRRDEQGAMAGLIGATNGLTFVVAPIAGTSLYGVNPSAPILVGAAISLAVVIFLLAHPRFRRQSEPREQVVPA